MMTVGAHTGMELPTVIVVDKMLSCVQVSQACKSLDREFFKNLDKLLVEWFV